MALLMGMPAVALICASCGRTQPLCHCTTEAPLSAALLPRLRPPSPQDTQKPPQQLLQQNRHMQERPGSPSAHSDDNALDVPDFEHVKNVVFGLDPGLPVAGKQQLSAWRAAFRSHLQEISRLEQVPPCHALVVVHSHLISWSILCTLAPCRLHCATRLVL